MDAGKPHISRERRILEIGDAMLQDRAGDDDWSGFSGVFHTIDILYTTNRQDPWGYSYSVLLLSLSKWNIESSFMPELRGRQGAWAAGGHPLKRNAKTSQLWMLPVEASRQRARLPHRTTTTPKDNFGNEDLRYLGLRQASRLILFKNQYTPEFPPKRRPTSPSSSNQRTVQPTPAALSLSFVGQHPPTLSISARPPSSPGRPLPGFPVRIDMLTPSTRDPTPPTVAVASVSPSWA